MFFFTVGNYTNGSRALCFADSCKCHKRRYILGEEGYDGAVGW